MHLMQPANPRIRLTLSHSSITIDIILKIRENCISLLRIYLFNRSFVVKHDSLKYCKVLHYAGPTTDPRFVNFLQLRVYFHYSYGSIFISSQIPAASNNADLKENTTLMEAALNGVAVACMTNQICAWENQPQETLMKNWKNHKKFNVTKQKQRLRHKIALMLRVFYWCFYLFLLTALYQGIINK